MATRPGEAVEEELGSGGGDGGLGVHGGGEKKEERAGKQAGRAGGHGGEVHGRGLAESGCEPAFVHVALEPGDRERQACPGGLRLAALALSFAL